jgi:hypothetical protein
LLSPRSGNAAPSRPYDAPSTEKARASVPPRPTGYLEQDEGGFSFSYHPSAHERVRAAIPAVQRARAALSAELGRDVLAGVEIRVAAVPDEMRTLGPVEDVPAYAPALVYSKHRLVVTSLRSPRSPEPTDLGATLKHALAHLALDEALDHRPVPVWLHEGHSAFFAGDASTARAQALVLATLKRRLLPLSELESSFPADAPEGSLAYAQSADLARFLTDKPRRGAFAAMISKMREGEHFEQALASAYEVNAPLLEQSWRKDVARRYGFLPVFVAGAAIWLVFGVILFVRRAAERRREKARLLARKAQRPRHELDGEVIAVAMGPAAMRMTAESVIAELEARENEGGTTILPETDVPKVEHEGDWHTLH